MEKAQDLTSQYYCGQGYFTAETLSKALANICDDQGKDLPICMNLQAWDCHDKEISTITYIRDKDGEIIRLELF